MGKRPRALGDGYTDHEGESLPNAVELIESVDGSGGEVMRVREGPDSPLFVDVHHQAGNVALYASGPVLLDEAHARALLLAVASALGQQLPAHANDA